MGVIILAIILEQGTGKSQIIHYESESLKEQQPLHLQYIQVKMDEQLKSLMNFITSYPCPRQKVYEIRRFEDFYPIHQINLN